MISDHHLVQLAEDSSPAAREALVSATADKFLDEARYATLMERTLFSDILVKLYSFARQEIRLKLSAALAMADWAPVELVRELALDAIDIAQPVISFCPVINDDILVEVVKICGLDHKICVAERGCIGERVSKSLISTEDNRILEVLAQNDTARISRKDFQRAMEVSKAHAETLTTFITRHDLPPNLVAAAYAMAGAEARSTITSRLSPKVGRRLTNLTELVVSDAAGAQLQSSQLSAMESGFHSAIQSSIRKSEPRPTPGFLVAALMRGEKQSFAKGLATLLDLPVAGVARKLESANTELIALAARAANFDVSIVRTVYETMETRQIPWTTGDDRTVAIVWMRCSPSSARTAFANDVRSIPN